MEDLDTTAKEIPISIDKRDDGLVLTHDLSTAGILYADIGFDLSGVDAEDICLIPLFSRLLKDAGTKTYDETALSRRIGSTTGGIGISTFSDLKHISGIVMRLFFAIFILPMSPSLLSTISHLPIFCLSFFVSLQARSRTLMMPCSTS